MDKNTIYIVTGIPRSGTSLMMQILHHSNLKVLTDHVRESDHSNPKGYFEYAPVKGIIKDKSFLKLAMGKVVKIVAPLPMYLDLNLSYKVIFMRRDIDEILMSQEKMLGKDQSSEREKFSNIYDKHIEITKHFLLKNNIEFIEIQYDKLIKSTSNQLDLISEFLKIKIDHEKISQVVDPSLYRNNNQND